MSTDAHKLLQAATRKAGRGAAEAMFALLLQQAKVPPWEAQYRFHPERRWRFDFAWPHPLAGSLLADTPFSFAVEIEGITRYGRRAVPCKGCGQPIVCKVCGKRAPGDMVIGGHQSAKGAQNDADKFHEAMVRGWIIYRITQHQIPLPETYTLIRSYVG